jgi:hypothetical protein
MSRVPQTFKSGDVTRAIKAAEKAGLKVQRAEVRRDGSILLDFDRPAKTQDVEHETSADIRRLL